MTAFYAYGAVASGLDADIIHDDLQWLDAHLDEWVARQQQAQAAARELISELQSMFRLDDLPDPAKDPDALARAVMQAASVPDHWSHQPWAERLFGRWTEDLPDTVAEVRQWLAGRKQPAPQGEDHQPAAGAGG